MTEIYEKIQELIALDGKKENNTFLEEANNFIEQYDFIKEEKPIVPFLYFLSKNSEALKWLKDLKEKDFESLDQFIIDSDYNEHIILVDIKYIKKYFEELYYQFDIDLIKIIFNLDGGSKIIKDIEYFTRIYIDLEKLSKKIKGKTQNFNELLNQIEKSTFYIKLNLEKKIYELISIKYNENEIIDSYKELILEKSFFAISHSMLKEEIHNKYKRVLEQNNYIKKYISLLNSKRNILYANKDEIEIRIINNEIIDIVEKKSIQELIELLKKEEEDEEKILIQFYENNGYLRLFSGLQILKIYEMIKEEKYSELQYILSPYINSKDNYYYPDEKIEIKPNASFNEKLITISNYFENIFKRFLNYDDIFKKNRIKEEYLNNYKNNIIYIKSYNEDEFESDCLDIFFTLTGNLPCFSNIFIFNDETIKLEFLPFLYKVLKTDSKCLFAIILKECKNGNEDNILIKINEILTKQRNSILILLYSKKNISKIEKYLNADSFEKFEFYNNINCKEEIKNILKDKVGLVYSDLSGTGKSKYIKRLIKHNTDCLYFPLNGYINKEQFISQLKNEIKIDDNKVNLIHIDLYDSLSENVIKEFFFSFLIFKFYGQDNNVFNYGFYNDNKIIILIELQNTYKYFFDKYKIFNYIPTKKQITGTNDIPTLNEFGKVKKIEDSQIQIVSNVLSLFKKGKIGEKNLNLFSKDLMDKNQYAEIIKEALINFIGNTKYNFYQIINFIKLLSSEFKNFTQCPNLFPSVFYEGTPLYFIELRKNIINSIIQNSKYVIELDNSEKQYFEINKNIQNELEREKNFESISSKIVIEKNVQMEKIGNLKPSFICMHNNQNFLSILSSDENCEILKFINKYINHLNSEYSSKNSIFMENIKNLSQLNREKDKIKLRHELFKIIIDENFQGDGEYIKIDSALTENFKDYVFTKDNFIKMVLLFLRISAGIPTIIMGETGCGKTYLVKMFSMIFGQNAMSMYTLKFHSGTTDDDVIKFIKDTVDKCNRDEDSIIGELNKNFENDKEKDIQSFEKKEKFEYENLWLIQKIFFSYKFRDKYDRYNENVKKDMYNKIKNRKIIIFFDEINTSNSLGTIKRLICDENYRNKLQIPERFIIICACNPYRALKEQNQNLQFGLAMRNKKNRKLVYTVNPLPYSMLNFILYFNDLSEETTMKYIEEMNENINCEISNQNRALINKLVFKSHFFIIKKGDISSVSLREINRFSKLFSFFHEKYLKIYRAQNSSKNELEIQSIALSLYFCYYLRLPLAELRQEYIQEIIENYIPLLDI